MDNLLKISIIFVILLIAFIILAVYFLKNSAEKIKDFYGANRKNEKENIVRKELIDE